MLSWVKAKTDPPIWPVSLLARRAQSDQLRRAGHGFQTPIELRFRTWRESRLEWSPWFEVAERRCAVPPGWIFPPELIRGSRASRLPMPHGTIVIQTREKRKRSACVPPITRSAVLLTCFCLGQPLGVG